MASPRIARISIAAALAVMGGEAGAQDPTVPPPPASSAPLAPEIAPTRRGECTPGRCTHRTPIGRRRCKRHLQEVFLGFPEEFERPPLGALMHAANGVQVSNGLAATMILNLFDFEPATTRLNGRGRDKLGSIAAQLPVSFAPVIVERSGDARLDEARRAAVVSSLESGPFPIPPGRVLVGPPISRGVAGEEALIIYGGMLDRSALAGPPVGVGVAPSSGAGAR